MFDFGKTSKKLKCTCGRTTEMLKNYGEKVVASHCTRCQRLMPNETRVKTVAV